MSKKQLVAVVATVVLSVVAYFFGADAVKVVKDAVGGAEVAPVSTE